MKTSAATALLALEDGSIWPGYSFGASGEATGEIVFNTSLTGYQEILTDPSYHGQLVTLTNPHIGNYGTTPEDDESDRVWAAGLIVRSLSPLTSNWRARCSLTEYLTERGIPGLTDVDTRALVRHIRTHGAMRAALSNDAPDARHLVEVARASRDMQGLDLAREVTCQYSSTWESGQTWWRPGGDRQETTAGVKRDQPLHVVAFDFGIKRNILRLLAAHGCRVTVVPAATPAASVMAHKPDGIFLSNGPGDPAAVDYAIATVRQLLGKKPIFGICLGHQILALALGARTYKLKFGHRGGNQPVQVTAGGAVEISSHNHGFAVDANSLPPVAQVTHVNLNDRCCEGLEAPTLHAFSVQYHPESSPGPHDSDQLFIQFVDLMTAFQSGGH
jgi:carbamoyl-phosphate synthase small subunit